MSKSKKPDSKSKAKAKIKATKPAAGAAGGASLEKVSAASAAGSDRQQARISTVHGEMVVGFWPEVAPNTVANFKKLVSEKYYDGLAFHRVVKGFMIQGGCPLSREDSPRVGTGGPGYQIKAEFNDRPHVRGVLSMARSSDPDSAGSQFFICLDDARFLDRQYTAFGYLISGDEVLEKIGNTPTTYGGSEKSKPKERMGITKIELIDPA